jgi:hypothetical protein
MDLDQLRLTLKTLRGQFEAASNRQPNLQHTVVAILCSEGANPNRLQGPPAVSSFTRPIHTGAGLIIQHEFRPVVGEKPPQAVANHFATNVVQWELPQILTNDRFQCTQLNAVESRLANFRSLADTAWDVTLQLPEAVWQLLLPRDPAPNLTNRLYLGPYRRLYERDKQLAQREREIAAGHDTSFTYVPDEDEYFLMGISGSSTSLWLLMVYNLAWRFDVGTPLKAQRHVWTDGLMMSFSKDESELQHMRHPALPGQDSIRMPIEWVCSDLSNVFLASVLAIDVITSKLDKSDSPPPSGDDLVGITKAADIAADILQDTCSEDTIRRRIEDGVLKRYERGGKTLVSAAEVQKKAHLLKQTVGKQKKQRRKRDAK